ncbi:hypothetical protein C8F04DRAFT_1191612 [Mycena alexandri]|uniref:Bacteriophage T5 Orf172 DNA-binding domain-containing protein n=1 Tax=Mycena alexandri TaxID=1745969 RepID=A0AAD6SD39_9AGAR|nr:hypothetical protein C8F04DRAFT_1191612 [Mycena alexandri]
MVGPEAVMEAEAERCRWKGARWSEDEKKDEGAREVGYAAHSTEAEYGVAGVVGERADREEGNEGRGGQGGIGDGMYSGGGGNLVEGRSSSVPHLSLKLDNAPAEGRGCLLGGGPSAMWTRALSVGEGVGSRDCGERGERDSAELSGTGNERERDVTWFLERSIERRRACAAVETCLFRPLRCIEVGQTCLDPLDSATWTHPRHGSLLPPRSPARGPAFCRTIAWKHVQALALLAGGILMSTTGTLEIKAGHTNNLERRLGEYNVCTPEYTFFWNCAYCTTRRMLLERLVHLALQQLGAKLRRYRCHRCGKRHREYYNIVRAGGFAGVERIIRHWLWKMGEIGSVSRDRRQNVGTKGQERVDLRWIEGFVMERVYAIWIPLITEPDAERRERAEQVKIVLGLKGGGLSWLRLKWLKWLMPA